MPPDHRSDPAWPLLARYLAGEVTPAETAEVDAWLAASPERRAMLEQARQIWHQSAELLPPEDVEAALGRIKTRDVEPVVIPLPAAQPSPRPTTLTRRWTLPSPVRWRQAVAALLVLGVGATVWQVSRRHQAAVVAPAPRMIDIATKRGERARLRLADGSSVVLGPESRLRFAATFATRDRELYLDGEAYIEAVHDTTKPLRVHTDRAVTEDIGTAFVVRAYPGSPTQVAVVDGSVLFRPLHAARAEHIVLAPAQRGTLRSDGSMVQESGIDLAPEVGWTEGRLVFANTSLRDAIPRLARWYDLDIHLADSALGDLRLNASFDREPASEVLQLIGIILDVGVERHGSSVVLHSRRRHP